MPPSLQRFFEHHPHPAHDTATLGARLQALVADRLDRLPSPGRGQTLQRWHALGLVAANDLGLCKLYEGHTDALAIMAELEASPVLEGSTWGMWAAEPPSARVRLSGPGARVRLDGSKAWCSGAAVLSHALITAWDEEDRQCLVAVALNQPGVSVTDQGWNAVGMAATASVEVRFEQAEALRVGVPGDYLSRPGFWQGGIGIAACWYGAAQRLGDRLLAHCEQRQEPHARAHLGAVDVALYGAACVLRDAARQLDATPNDDAQLLARRCRGVVEHTVDVVLRHSTRALGAGPLCQEPVFAHLAADLPVYLRQSHAERDLAALGTLLSHSPPSRQSSPGETAHRSAWPL